MIKGRNSGCNKITHYKRNFREGACLKPLNSLHDDHDIQTTYEGKIVRYSLRLTIVNQLHYRTITGSGFNTGK